MAKREQCFQCKGFNPQSELCTIKWVQPAFDDLDCPEFKDSLSFTAPKTGPDTTMDEGNDSQLLISNARKREASITGKAIHISNKWKAERTGEEKQKDAGIILELPETTFHFVSRLFVILLLGVSLFGAFYGIREYIQYKERQEREDLVWKARIELESMRSEKKVSYLRLFKMAYKDKLLTLSFLRNPNNNYNSQITDSVILEEISSIVAIAPNKWDTICYYLGKATTNLQIVYEDVLKKPALIIDSQDLSNKLLSEKAKENGLKLFTKLKGAEILQYARIHFGRDGFFHADNISIDHYYVRLNLSYDDSKAKLGKSYLDTTSVNPHFTDPIGEMGSILDGMLTICTRTNRGFGFIYTGRKNHKVDRCEYSSGKTKAIAEMQSNSLPIQGRKTNQVHTILVKEKKKN